MTGEPKPESLAPAERPARRPLGANELGFSPYGFRWGPLEVERTAYVPGRGYVVTIQTEGVAMQVYVSERGRVVRSHPPGRRGR